MLIFYTKFSSANIKNIFCQKNMSCVLNSYLKIMNNNIIKAKAALLIIKCIIIYNLVSIKINWTAGYKNILMNSIMDKL